MNLTVSSTSVTCPVYSSVREDLPLLWHGELGAVVNPDDIEDIAQTLIQFKS